MQFSVYGMVAVANIQKLRFMVIWLYNYRDLCMSRCGLPNPTLFKLYNVLALAVAVCTNLMFNCAASHLRFSYTFT